MKNVKTKLHSFFRSITLVFFTTTLVLFLWNQNPYSLNGTIFSAYDNNTPDQEILKHPQYNLISNLQTAFVRNAKTVGPSVVNLSKVHAEVNFNSSHDSFYDNNSWFFSLKNLFDKYLSKKKYISKTIGSGVIINEKGYILTNYHVIKGHDKILVRLSDQRSFFADVIGVDSKTDLAVIKINSFRRLPQPVFGPSTEIKVGQWVMAIGNPYGLQGSVTVGVVSGVHRSNLGIATYENFLQTDAAINPGNSGGPLINLSGEIVGINTSVAALGSGVGFAIPIDIALRISGELINNGSVQRGWIGVGVQEMTPALFLAFKIHDSKKGILVNNVENNAPAKKAGIMRGDIVLKYNGRHVRSVKNFQSMVADTQIGKQVFIDVIRDRLEKTLLITIGELTS